MAIILVADDHPLNRHFLATLLSYYGHQVNEAADGVEALESARQIRPDLIIADVAMPRLDGFALVQTLRSEPDLAKVPVIFYTASYREEESRAIAKAAGIEHLISKPSDPEVILDIVNRVLGRLAGAPPATSHPDAKQYVEWLQTSSIRMSALIELGLELYGEPDPERVLGIACRAFRAIFEADYAVISVNNREPNVAIDGPVDQSRIADLVGRVKPALSSEPRNVAGESDPLVQAARGAMREVGAILLLPMTRAGDTYGWILLGKFTGGHFSTDDERLGVAAAAQVRAIHENLRHSNLLSRQRERVEGELLSSRENFAAIFDASPVSMIAFDQHGVVEAWNRSAERIFGWTADETVGRRNPTIPPEGEAAYQSIIAKCLAGETLSEVELTRKRRDGARIDVTMSMAPLHDADGAVRGCVSIVNDITDRNRTEAELRYTSERLHALSGRLLSILEDERTRISRELHDDLGQLITAIKIDVSRFLGEVAKGAIPPASFRDGIILLIDNTLETVGRIVTDLRPSRIGEVGLVAAIERKLADFQQRTEIECELSFRPEEFRVSDAAGTAAFRILEEALTNVARHSGATRVEVRVRQDQPNELLLEVRDNGRGIEDTELHAETSYGLMGMRERAYVLGGSVNISGIKGKGTIVTARIPVENSR